MKKTGAKSFPKDFYWGCSTSAHQIEGHTVNDWSEWEQSPERRQALLAAGKNPDEFISGRACDSWNQFEADLACLKQLGVNSYRFSLEWSRIEPVRGQFNSEVMDRYAYFVRRLKESGIEPFVTLWHWPIPLWVRDRGGWLASSTVEDFNKFADYAAAALRGQVKYWLTINEPLVYASNSYFNGVWPPQQKSLWQSIKVLRHLVQAHRAAYRTIKTKDLTAQVGLAKHNIYFSAKQPWLFNQLAVALGNYFWNSWFLNRVRRYQDFIGLNYYFHQTLDFKFGHQAQFVSDLGWELYPEGLFRVLKDLKRYGKPIFITEHGLADKDDRHRAWYLQESLKYVHQAQKEGVDLRGYFHWSLLDNFEWSDGFFPRFGLFEVDMKTCERKPRASVAIYRDLIKNNGKN